MLHGWIFLVDNILYINYNILVYYSCMSGSNWGVINMTEDSLMLIKDENNNSVNILNIPISHIVSATGNKSEVAISLKGTTESVSKNASKQVFLL